MGLYEDKCPTMAAAGVAEADAVEAVTFDPAPQPEADVDKPVTVIKVKRCLNYFKWRGASAFPQSKAAFVGWTFESVAKDVNLSLRQVKALHEEYVAYRAAVEGVTQ